MCARSVDDPYCYLQMLLDINLVATRSNYKVPKGDIVQLLSGKNSRKQGIYRLYPPFTISIHSLQIRYGTYLQQNAQSTQMVLSWNLPLMEIIVYLWRIAPLKPYVNRQLLLLLIFYITPKSTCLCIRQVFAMILSLQVPNGHLMVV